MWYTLTSREFFRLLTMQTETLKNKYMHGLIIPFNVSYYLLLIYCPKLLTVPPDKKGDEVLSEQIISVTINSYCEVHVLGLSLSLPK